MKMKKNILAAVFIGFSIVMIGLNAWGTPIVSLALDSSDLTVGDSFNVLVSASGISDDDLVSFGFDLAFDSAEFSWTSAVVGTAFLDDSDALGDTDVAGSVFPGVGGDDILLATLSFTALSEGVDLSLGILSDTVNDLYEGLWTVSGGQIDLTGNIIITVNGAANPVPEPSTLVLVFMGLISIAGLRKLNNRAV